ncbi:hypothetical protein GL279_06895 [Paracoccus limosus]|uniref:Uncharacterized protein n=1 Tax=Paracoccus limosus TaxID=913252 RepID=A0A844H0B4_9RHOB|nr:hypothetical protein [Paracoccus limosus]MTH34326.1 hypothetical protein [Paracoccus limosus]
MSFNTDPKRAARRHPAAITGIIVALAVAVIALVWWMGADPVKESDVGRIESPAAPETKAGGIAEPVPTTTTPAPDSSYSQ